MKEIIHLLHTNDIHSHLEKWPKLRRWINDTKRVYKEEKEWVFTFDIGDFLDRVHPLTEATDGLANVELMNQVHYDAVTIGNNEGITNSKQVLNDLYKKANFPIVLSNLKDLDTQDYPVWAQPYIIITTKEKTKIGVFGLTAQMELSYYPFGWQVIDPYSATEEIVKELSKKVNVIILLSHLGIIDDKKMAQRYPEIDVILGSHTHHLLPKGLMVNGVLLCAAGRFGEHVGDVTIELTDNIVTKKSARTISSDSLWSDSHDQQESEEFYHYGDFLLEQKSIAHLEHELDKENTLISITLEAMKAASGCDVAMVNSGLFLTDIGPGLVNAKQLHTSLPHPMNLIKVTLNGKEMIRLAKEVAKNRDFLRRFPIVGMKFRGKYFGEIWYDGFNYDDITNEGFWLNKPIEDEKEYSFVTVDHIAFVPFFPTIEIAGKIEILGPSFLRNHLATYLSKLNTKR